VNQPDDLQILLMMKKLRGWGANNASCLEFFAVPADEICGARPDAEAIKDLRDMAVVLDLLSFDGFQDIATVDTGFVRRTIRNNQTRFNAIGGLDPRSPVIRRHILPLLLRVQATQNQDADRK